MRSLRAASRRAWLRATTGLRSFCCPCLRTEWRKKRANHGRSNHERNEPSATHCSKRWRGANRHRRGHPSYHLYSHCAARNWRLPSVGPADDRRRRSLLATAHRVVYGIAGSYIAARFAPDRPVQHALVLGVFGVIVSIVGAVVRWNRGPAFGPHWYPLALVATAIPCAWLGGKLRVMQLRERPATKREFPLLKLFSAKKAFYLCKQRPSNGHHLPEDDASGDHQLNLGPRAAHCIKARSFVFHARYPPGIGSKR